MTKEMFVSSTPHETRVGLVEDDQLAEIYLERENEYTLAGSIYRGRVTRVLPGMQSAFVDIGLERDAFLYVSDFMELEDQDELDEVPTDRTAPAPEPRHQQQQHRDELQPALPEAHAATFNDAESQPQAEAGQQPSENSDTAKSGNRERGGWRGRRRRRGRRGERMPESKFARPAGEAQREAPPRAERPDRPERHDRPERSERTDFGPPPGYQPMILPGESISKYSLLAQAQAAAPARAPSPTPSREIPAPPIAETFPEDEPLFAKPATEDRRQTTPPRSQAPTETKPATARREQKRFDEMNVAAVFGGGATESEEQSQEDDNEDAQLPTLTEHSDQSLSAVAGNAGTIEEEEIEEEEADLAAYVEELEEDDAFEELEEETHAAADYQETAQVIAAVGEPATGVSEPLAAQPISLEPGIAEVAEEDETDEVEAELDEAQAEAEAVVEAETGAGNADARAEVRAPAATAPYTQRAPRPAFDRNRGRRGGGGRRFRRNEPQNVPLITDLLKEGQEILVQIAKEPIGKKGARITSHIALPGRFLVYMPTVNHTGVSRKISSEDERQRLKRIILSERENGHGGGFIVRTAAQNASEEDLRADIRFLKGLWAEIKNRADNGKGPTLIYHDLNVVERVLRDQVSSEFSAIWVDSEQEYERILRFANRFQPALVKRVKLYTKETPLFEQFGLSEEINKALKSKVWLKSGGDTVVKKNEARVAIDVNNRKNTSKTARPEDTMLENKDEGIKQN